MTIDIKDLITLSNDIEYIVASKVLYKENTYYYLINQNNNADIKFCYTKPDNEKLFLESKDKEINTKLLPLFIKEAKKAIPDLFKDFKELDDIEVE
jgi:hypothetical protein